MCVHIWYEIVRFYVDAAWVLEVRYEWRVVQPAQMGFVAEDNCKYDIVFEEEKVKSLHTPKLLKCDSKSLSYTHVTLQGSEKKLSMQ